MAARCSRFGCAFRQNQTGSSSSASKAEDCVTLGTTGLQLPSSEKSSKNLTIFMYHLAGDHFFALDVMKKLFSITLMAMAAFAVQAYAITLTSEDLSGSGALPTNYQGLTWTGWSYYDAAAARCSKKLVAGAGFEPATFR